MGGGDIYHHPYEVIDDLCQRYSRETSRSGKGPRDTLKRINKISNGGFT
jgi:hypothetical protein